MENAYRNNDNPQGLQNIYSCLPSFQKRAINLPQSTHYASNDLCLPGLAFRGRHLFLTLQLLQDKFLSNVGNFLRRIPARELHVAFKSPYVYDFVTVLRRQQAEVIQNYENATVRNIGQGKAVHRKYKRLKLGGGQAYDRSSDYAVVITQDGKIGHNLLYKAWQGGL